MAAPGFLEERLSPAISVGCSGGPTNPGRTMTRLPNGMLIQGFNGLWPVHTYDIGYVKREAAYVREISDLWYVINFPGENDSGPAGPYTGFRFKDWGDFEATQLNSKLTLISGSDWQLHRVMKKGNARFLRPIQKPCADPAVVIWRTRDFVAAIASATVDYTTGIATIFGHVEGDTYTWEGEFDVPVTFTDNEWLRVLQVNTQALHIETPSIKLEEFRQP
jgi:uncharacterized protein (TIGR02217 family)